MSTASIRKNQAVFSSDNQQYAAAASTIASGNSYGGVDKSEAHAKGFERLGSPNTKLPNPNHPAFKTEAGDGD